jgi:fibronectin-binding autotransporter adhesin
MKDRPAGSLLAAIAEASWSFGLGMTLAALLWRAPSAKADCAAGDGNIDTAGLCTIPQKLAGPTGIVVDGATLSTGTQVAYTASGSPAAVTNAGTILSSGTAAFLYNFQPNPPPIRPSGSIQLTNTGSIIAEQGVAVAGAGFSENIINTGTIIGGNGTAIGLTTFFGTFTQGGGLIQGDVNLGFGNTINIKGGIINGNISAGDVNFDLGSGTFTTGGTIKSGGNTSVLSGTLILANDVQSSFAFNNNGMLRIQGVRTISVAGNFVNASSATMVFDITPSGSSRLVIQKTNLFNAVAGVSLGGTIKLAYQAGIYAPRVYTLVSTDESVAPNTGSFSAVAGTVPTPGLVQTIIIGPHAVELSLGPAPPINAGILPGVASAIVLNGQRMTGILLDQLGSRAAGDDSIQPRMARPAPVHLAQTGNLAALGEIASTLPRALADQGAWFRGIGDFFSLNGNAAAPGFTGSSGGFLAGFDRAVQPDFSLGVAAGYLHSDLGNAAVSTSRIDSGRFAVYGAGWWGPSLLTGTTGYAYDRVSTARTLTGIGSATSGHDGHEFSIAGQWSLPIPLAGITGSATITPKLGIQYLHLFETGIQETRADGFNLSAGTNDTDSLQPFVRFVAADKFITADGTEIMPEMRLAYCREVLSNNRLLRVSAIDGTPFVVRGVKPSRDMVTVGGGISVRARDRLSLYANYDTVLHTGNTSEQTVSAGVRIQF